MCHLSAEEWLLECERGNTGIVEEERECIGEEKEQTRARGVAGKRG